jgi:hypothetical protein
LKHFRLRFLGHGTTDGNIPHRIGIAPTAAIRGSIAFMTRPISGAERIDPTLIQKPMQRIDTCCREHVILTASCPNKPKQQAWRGHLTPFDAI